MQLSRDELEGIITNQGLSLYDISNDRPILLVFLRHLGCIFCREALKDISRHRQTNIDRDEEIVLVHMESLEVAERFFSKFDLQGCQHVEDMSQQLYRRFGLTRGSFSQLFGFKTMVRGFQAGISMDQFGGQPFGDAFQMPGIFVIHKGMIVSEYIHRTVSDRPDYQQLLDCCLV
ncbi:MAG: redoxin domain-containing protein [Saprospiraceae bacterium]|nr:redoxin domain-containing protein [Saprospiraceae bacterium]